MDSHRLTIEQLVAAIRKYCRGEAVNNSNGYHWCRTCDVGYFPDDGEHEQHAADCPLALVEGQP
jgi:hypothetical protein